VLYVNFRSKPKLFDPSAVDAALAGMKSTDILRKMEPDEKLSDEDHIKNLLGLRSYAHEPEMPTETVMTNIAVNIVNVLRGKKKLVVGVEHAILDSLRAGGGFAGAKLGGISGLLLTPILLHYTKFGTYTVPALMFVGAWSGSFFGKKLGGRVKERHAHAARKKLKRVSHHFRKCFLAKFPGLLKKVDFEFKVNVAYTLKLRRRSQSVLTRYFFPRIMLVFYTECVGQMKKDWEADRERWKQINRKVRSMDPMHVSGVLHGLRGEGLVSHPELLDHSRAYDQAVQDLEEAKKKSAA